MTTRTAKSAFTLIELILAITLFASVTVTAYLCLSTATRSWRVGTETADAINHGDYIMEQILMGLRSAYYPDVDSVDGSAGQYGMQLVNDGDEDVARDSLTWVKLGSALVGADSEVANTPHKVVLTVVGEGESEDEALAQGGLVLKSWRMSALPEDFDPDDDEFVKPLLLMPGVVALDFRVFNPKDNLEDGKLPGVEEESPFELDDEKKWIDEDWTGDYTNRLPYAVETTLYLAPPDDRSDPIKVQRVTTIPTAFLSWPEKFKKSRSGNDRNRSGNGQRQQSGARTQDFRQQDPQQRGGRGEGGWNRDSQNRGGWNRDSQNRGAQDRNSRNGGMRNQGAGGTDRGN